MNQALLVRVTHFPLLNSGLTLHEVSSNFLIWEFCANTQFPQSFSGLARNSAEPVCFQKIPTLGNKVKLRYFGQRKVTALGCKLMIV